MSFQSVLRVEIISSYLEDVSELLGDFLLRLKYRS